LMAIQLLVQAALARGGASSLTDDDLELIARENVRIERTAQNLLDFARPPALARRRFAVAELVENCVALVSGRAAMQRVGVVEETRGAAEAIGDFQQLQQVILNMLLNALDSTPGGGKIRIVAETIDEDGEPRLKISVADDGHGIPEGTLPKIFDPFVSTKETGTGLGLSISKQIVEAHQGEMFARNRPSGGAVVGFLIPLSGTTAG
jgi:two-component system sensor histidine kinase HydH